MPFFSNKVAIVTGAGSGIGKALSEELIRQGAIVVLGDIQLDRLKVLVDSCGSSGDRVRAICLDVTEFEEVKKLVEETIKTHGRIDYLFNNAGIVVGGEVRDCTIEDWRAVLKVNLMGVVNGVAAAYPVMVSQGFGHIVNTGSIEGLVPFPGTISYVTSKYGVVGLSTALRIEGKALGVKVSVVCPGYIQTRIFDDAKLVNLDRQKIQDSIPERLAMTPEKCTREILKGVGRNRGVIVITAAAKITWRLQRFFPGLVQFIMGKSLSKSRLESRLEK